MKARTWSHVWWLGINKDIERTVCQQIQHDLGPAGLHPWSWPQTPCTGIHVEFARPIEGYMILVVVNAQLKWPEVFRRTSSTATKMIGHLCTLFSQCGLSLQLMNDNGPHFCSKEFQKHLASNEIQHICSAS
ncbi:unnamed protein product [Lepidochelys kempii]